MRTREEIEKRYFGGVYPDTVEGYMLEVLLDIRDLLEKPQVNYPEFSDKIENVNGEFKIKQETK